MTALPAQLQRVLLRMRRGWPAIIGSILLLLGAAAHLATSIYERGTAEMDLATRRVALQGKRIERAAPARHALPSNGLKLDSDARYLQDVQQTLLAAREAGLRITSVDYIDRPGAMGHIKTLRINGTGEYARTKTFLGKVQVEMAHAFPLEVRLDRAVSAAGPLNIAITLGFLYSGTGPREGT
jgi:hypothetical protein